jgi:ankyrin repeat protein
MLSLLNNHHMEATDAINMNNHVGESPPMIAVQNGRHKTIRFLLERESGVGYPNKNGKISPGITFRRGKEEVVTLPWEHDAEVDVKFKLIGNPLPEQIARMWGEEISVALVHSTMPQGVVTRES